MILLHRPILIESKQEETPKSRKTVHVSDKMQKGYSYELTMPEGDFSDFQEKYPEFKPYYTPKQMLEMGVFEGVYMRDCHKEFPSSWFTKAKEAEGDPDPELNKFKVKSRRPLPEWRKNGWIYGDDPRGWFQWYCRAYAGRRDPKVDDKQIKRWLSFARHAAQVKQGCKPGDLTCRVVQRQALLQWAYKCDI
jgi:hypothetical protein